MAKSDAWENAYLRLLFNNEPVLGIGDSGGLLPSVVAGELFLSLHLASPLESGNQSTNEATYGNYARIAVPRDSSGFTVIGNSVNLTEEQDFPMGTGGSGIAVYFGIGTALSGAGLLLYSGPITPTVITGKDIAPRFLTTIDLVTED